MKRLTVSTEEFRKKVGDYVRAAARGEQITFVMYHGVPGAALVPLSYISAGLADEMTGEERQ